MTVKYLRTPKNSDEFDTLKMDFDLTVKYLGDPKKIPT